MTDVATIVGMRILSAVFDQWCVEGYDADNNQLRAPADKDMVRIVSKFVLLEPECKELARWFAALNTPQGHSAVQRLQQLYCEVGEPPEPRICPGGTCPSC